MLQYFARFLGDPPSGLSQSAALGGRRRGLSCGAVEARPPPTAVIKELRAQGVASLRRPADSRVRLPDPHHPRENRFFCRPLQHSCFQSQMKLGAAAAKSLQSCPTLCDPVDSSPPGSSVPGILQTRVLEWVAISFSKIGRVGFNIHSTENLSPSPNSSYYISIYMCKIKFW